jgi:hypothetical protein
MAKGKFDTRVQKNTAVLNAIRKAMPENTRQFVVDVATDMAEQFAILAARDTGAMAESVYVQMKDGAYLDGKPTSVSAVEAIAKALRPDAEMSPSPIPTNDTTAYVKPVVKYYVFVERGTTKMAARPAMATARAIAQRNLKSKHMPAMNKIVTDGHR